MTVPRTARQRNKAARQRSVGTACQVCRRNGRGGGAVVDVNRRGEYPPTHVVVELKRNKPPPVILRGRQTGAACS